MMVLRDKCGHIFGAYVSESWEIKSQFYGKLKSSQFSSTACLDGVYQESPWLKVFRINP